MKRQIILIVISTLLSVSSYSHNWKKISSDNPIPIQKELIESSDQRIVIKFNLEGFFMTPVETPRGKEYRISVPDMVFISDKSMPELPMHGVSAIIPDLDLMNVRILSSNYTDFTDIDVAPSKGHYTRSEDPDKIPFTYGYAYTQDEFYPDVLSELREPYIFRDYRGQTLVVYPISYNPVQKVLRVYHEFTVEIFNEGTGGANQYFRDRISDKMVREFKAIYNRHFINASQYRYPILEEEGNLLIICHGPWVNAVQPLAEWKKTIGRPTEIVDASTIGTIPAALKAFITNYYNTKGLTHLLLVGDHQQIPSYDISGEYSDYYYGYILGDDSYSEVFVGRFSAESVQDVETQVQRTIYYERDINESDTWLNTGIGIARNEGAGNGHNGGESDYEHIDFIRDSLLNYTYATVYREYDGNVPGLPNTTAEQISQRINDGATIINFCNHGSMSSWSVGGFNVNHIKQLNNIDKHPFIWSCACENGKFTSGTCFAEVWMRSRHNVSGEPIGAIGTMMSWISQPWQAPMTGQDEMVTILVEKRDHIKRTLGGVSINGSAKMIEAHGNIGRHSHDTWFLFGDPSLTLRTANPTLINATHDSVLMLGSTELIVNADAEGAIVSLTHDGEIIGTGYIENGSVVIQFPELTTPGLMKITILGYNRVTYMQEIKVIPNSDPFLVYYSNIINDVTGGNGNGKIEYGESVILGVEIKNIGLEQASDIIANLTTTSPYVTITDNVENYGNLLPDQVMMKEDAFKFTVADNVPDYTRLQFELQLTDGIKTWTSSFYLVAYAPHLSIVVLNILDQAGNNNGQVDPDETLDLKIQISNSGSSYTNSIEGILYCSNPYINVDVGNVYAEALAPEQTSYLIFTITIDENAPIGAPIYMINEVTSGSYTGSKIFLLQVGLTFEDFESGNFTMFPWVSGGDSPWVITGDDPYQGSYSARSGNISQHQTSQLIIDYDVGASDSVSFYRKLSSVANFDFLRFYISDQMMAQWSGDIPWGRVVFPVKPGIKTFKWEFKQEASFTPELNYAKIDYIVFPPTSPCPAPKNLNATSVYANSAVLNWDAGYDEGSWDLKWELAGFDPYETGNIVEFLNTTSYNLTDLAASKYYDFYVRSICDENMTSAWNGPFTFSTLCEPFQIPYFEPFGTSEIVYWTFPDGQGNWNFGDLYTPPSSNTGAPNAYFYYTPTILNYSHSFTSPLFNGTNFSDIKLDYILFISNYNNSTIEQLAVEYKSIHQLQWTLLENFSTAELTGIQSEYIRVDQILEGMTGREFQIRFRAYGQNSYNINGWGLDDIHVYGVEFPMLAGDANCDGIINILDAITIVNYVIGYNPQPFCFENADVTVDGTINILDVIGTVNIIFDNKKSHECE